MPLAWKLKAHYWLRDSPLWDRLLGIRARRQQKKWEQGGRFGPPHIIKQQMLLDHAQRFQTNVLVETGTFLGDMIYAMKDHFKEIYSIELSDELHARAKSAFRKSSHVHLVSGDSATALEHVLDRIRERSLFWLDGHYSGGVTALGSARSPVRAEIEAILRHPIKDHVILIDDAICFDGEHGYPTLFELHDTVVSRFPGHEMQVFDNVIQVRPKR
jgi:hypothetical protein